MQRAMFVRTLAINLMVALVALMTLAGQPSSAQAQSLGEAKAAGHVGERFDGYVAAVPGASANAVAALVQQVNQERRAVYAEIATRQNLSVSAVAALAGRKLLAEAPAGAYIQDQSGAWHQK